MTLFKEALGRTKLERLSINNCLLGEQGGIAMGEALVESNLFSLKYISAKNNGLKDEAAKAISDGLKCPYIQLAGLDLSSNKINDAGGELIAEALSTNMSLNYLNLSSNNLRATSAAVFVTSLNENHHIKQLKLKDNSITNDFIAAVNKLLKRNQSQNENTNAHLLDL